MYNKDDEQFSIHKLHFEQYFGDHNNIFFFDVYLIIIILQLVLITV